MACFILSKKIRYKDAFITHIIYQNNKMIILKCDDNSIINFHDLKRDFKKEIRDSYPEIFI